MKLVYLIWMVVVAVTLYPKAYQLSDQEATSILMVAPHNSHNKDAWDVVLGELASTDTGGQWGCFGGAVDQFFKDSLFGNVFSVSTCSLSNYLEKSSIYRFIFPDGASVLVVPFADSIIDSYLTGFYDALYHQQRKTRYARRRGIYTSSVTKLAVVAWDTLMDAVKTNESGQVIKIPAQVASKRIRGKKGKPTFVSEIISLDPELEHLLSYIAHERPYTKGAQAGTRLYA